MKKILLGLVATLPLLASAQSDPHFTMRPALSPDAQTIYFEYDSDIWRVATAGGDATRITAMEGYEGNPIVSPDGKWLTFSSNQNGNTDVYVLPLAGGDIRQLTFSSAAETPSAWSPDSKTVYVSGGQYNNISAYSVPVEGGSMTRLFPNYFNTIANLVQMNDGSFLFNESTESYRYQTRKGYVGDHNPDIKKYNVKSKKYEELTTFEGKDIWPATDGNGNIYFASYEGNGEANLAKIEGGKTKMLTSFKNSIQSPKISFDGSKVVFNLDYKIYVYDTKTGKSVSPKINLASKNQINIPLKYSTEGRISNYAVSADGKKIAFVSRGRMFVSDITGKVIKEMMTDSKERVVEVKWDKDNQTIYFTRTRNGWYNLFSISANSNASEKPLYTPDEFIKNVSINSNNDKLLYTIGGNQVGMFVNGQNKVLIDNLEFWVFRENTYRINLSKDEKYVVFNGVNMMESDLFIYDIANKKLTNITNSATPETLSYLTPDNKYIYMIANRYAPTFPRGTVNGENRLYRLPLNHYAATTDNATYENLFADKDAAKTKEHSAMNLNLDRIYRRWEQQRGEDVYQMYGVDLDDESYVIYRSSHSGDSKPYLLKVDADGKAAPKAIKGFYSLGLATAANNKIYVLSNGSIYNINPKTATASKIDIEFEFAQKPIDAFNAMAYQTWAQMKTSFYDKNMHGVDWDSKLKYYMSFLPYLQNRENLRTMMNDMLFELNASHLGFSGAGMEERVATKMVTAYTGVMFDNNNHYSVDYILSNSPADNVDMDIKRGDKLVAVNGKAVDTSVNIDKYFTFATFPSELTLTFDRNGSKFDTTIKTINNTKLKDLIYYEWEDSRRASVNEKSNNSIAYVHMRNMSGESLDKFLIEMSTDAVHKNGLILDLRFNTGGNVHDEVIEYLTRKSYFVWGHRNHPKTSHPNFTPGDKPIVVLINERSLSDAETTSNGIKSLGAATLIGTETYRWIIFTSSADFADGSTMRMPAWGCYTLDGQDLEKIGVSPDIYIKNTFDDRINGRDPQLDRAIQEIQKQLKK